MQWRYSEQPLEYLGVMESMEARVKAIHSKQSPEMIWVLQHQPVFTAGTGINADANAVELINNFNFPVHHVGRGGKFTYHGPGQLVVYPMIDLIKRKIDLKQFITTIEEWIILCLGKINITAERRPGRVGLWVVGANSQREEKQGGEKQREEKIAAIGLRISRGVSWHGFSINISPNLAHFGGIIPCGLPNYGVTSCAALGKKVSLRDFYQLLVSNCPFY